MALTVLDSSVVIGVLDRDDAHHGRAWAALDALDYAYLAMPVTALSEVFVGVLRGGPDATRVFETFRRQLAIRTEPVTEPIALTAAHLRFAHRGLRVPDALVIATGEVLDADTVLTADRRWRGVSTRVRVV